MPVEALETREKLRCITLAQPFAHLVAIGQKWADNRPYTVDYVGPLLIHANKSGKWIQPGADPRFDCIAGLDVMELVLGAIVAGCWLAACVPLDQARDPKWAAVHCPGLEEHPHVYGPYVLLLTDVVRFSEPIYDPGGPDLWELHPHQLPRGTEARTWADDQLLRKEPY